MVSGGKPFYFAEPEYIGAQPVVAMVCMEKSVLVGVDIQPAISYSL